MARRGHPSSGARGWFPGCPLADDVVKMRKHVRPGLPVLVSGLLVPETRVGEPKVRTAACWGQLDGHHGFILRGRREPRHFDEASGLELQEPAVMGMALIFEMHLEEVRRVDVRSHQDALGSGKPLLKVRPRLKQRSRGGGHGPLDRQGERLGGELRWADRCRHDRCLPPTPSSVYQGRAARAGGRGAVQAPKCNPRLPATQRLSAIPRTVVAMDMRPAHLPIRSPLALATNPKMTPRGPRIKGPRIKGKQSGATPPQTK